MNLNSTSNISQKHKTGSPPANRNSSIREYFIFRSVAFHTGHTRQVTCASVALSETTW